MLDVTPLFPHTREQLRKVFIPDPRPFWVETTAVMMDEPVRDNELVQELIHLDPVGRALCLQLRCYRYKPGWTFRLIQRGFGSSDPRGLVFDTLSGDSLTYQIKIEGRMPDSRWTPGPEKTEKDRPLVGVTSTHGVWPNLWLAARNMPDENLRMFRAMLRDMIQRMEDHELDEWLSEDGELIDDPHARKVPSKIGPIE